MTVFGGITNKGVATTLCRRSFANDKGRLDGARRLQRFAHRFDWCLAIEPDGKRERALM
jgi:hypothetical protein